jgi:arylsulfatase A-like enzyme
LNVFLVLIDSLRKDHVGAYGNDWIETPNMDRLAGESLVFERALPESIPTINARRAIHTGTRSWPFKDWVVPKGEDIRLQGWQPIPEGQTTLAQVLGEHGYRSMMVTDTMHQFKPSYNMHEGCDAFDFIRGQTTDNCQPTWTYPPEKDEKEGLFDVKEDPEMRRSVAGERQEVLDFMWNDYVLADAGGPLRRC